MIGLDHHGNSGYPHPGWGTPPSGNWWPPNGLRDYGPYPFTINIEKATLDNSNFRTALWTGKYLQLTLMSIDVGEDIGLEMHPDVDQFIRVEQGTGLVLMGDNNLRPNFRQKISEDSIAIIPAGKWHNVINTGPTPLKLYSIYAPPEHPHGTIHRTRRDAEEHHHNLDR